jgi:xanthine dehydrogenase accessory factor
LIVVGAVHIAQSLAPIARHAGYAVTIVDPRATFATAARFPETALVVDWPDKALPALRPDVRTAIVSLTHQARMDDAGLSAGLRSDAFYLGALGSRRTHAQRCERLRAAGFQSDALERIHGPIGLPIGALTPGEIAIAVMAEITATLRRTPLNLQAPVR